MVKKLTILAMVPAIMLVGASSTLARTVSERYGKSATATGVPRKQSITSYQYGTHFITDERSRTGYVLWSGQLNLDRYVGERVTPGNGRGLFTRSRRSLSGAAHLGPPH